MARPSKYDPAFCDVAEATLAQGYSEAVLAGELGVCIDTITEWKKVHPEFSASVKVGRAKGARVWEDRLKALAEKNEGNATGIIFGLKNRLPDAWKDKTETELSGEVGVRKIEREIVRPPNTNG
jgi:transposase